MIDRNALISDDLIIDEPANWNCGTGKEFIFHIDQILGAVIIIEH